MLDKVEKKELRIRVSIYIYIHFSKSLTNSFIRNQKLTEPYRGNEECGGYYDAPCSNWRSEVSDTF